MFVSDLTTAECKNDKTREEILALKRLKERERYHKLKEDPVKHALHKERERMKYIRTKLMKKVKKIVSDVKETKLEKKRKEIQKYSSEYRQT